MGSGNGDERIARTESSTCQTTDLPIAAYYLLSGLEIIRVTKRRAGGGASQDFVFVFADPDGKSERLQVEWVNSDLHRYDAAVRSLKKLCSEARKTRNDDRRPVTASR